MIKIYRKDSVKLIGKTTRKMVVISPWGTLDFNFYQRIMHISKGLRICNKMEFSDGSIADTCFGI